jgi:PAS domain S-box-containing protein
VNKSWCEIAGLSHQKALNHGWADATHPDDRQHVIDEWHRAITQREVFSSEYRFQRSYGVTTWVLCQAVTEKDSHGEPIGSVGTITDITERRHAEEALRQNHVLLSAIMETSTDFIYVNDLEGRYLLTNPSLAQFMGKPVEDIIGQNDHVLLRPELAASCMALDQQVISSGTALTQEEQGILEGRPSST